MQFDVENVREISIDGAPVTIVDIHLRCKLDITPWCVTPQHLQATVDEVTGDMSYEEAKKLEVALAKHGLPAKVRNWKQD